jgi:NAD(P)-dependent dehydrogenase (short-subunit alcohol dehydrogenase family)
MKLKGKSAVITGGGSGIGRAIATLFASKGARVAVVDRDDAGAQVTVQQIVEAGGAAEPYSCDVGDPASVDSAASQVFAAHAGVDILVTAAGFSCGGTVLTTSVEDWDAVFRANVGGTWLWARAVIPSMQKRNGGAIITFASQLAVAGGRGNSAYIAAKGAILSLTRTMALDFAPDRIRVNAIAPGAIETPMLARSFARHAEPEKVRDASRRRHALERFGKPSEIAEAALYLASDGAAFTTGTTLVVDGGWLAA